jgi:DNA-binding NarL/FixJ family response regulator
VTNALRQLTDAVAILSDEARVLELAVAALHEACPRGATFGLTSRMQGGAIVPIDMSHAAYVRTPAIEVDDVPVDQRNRWVEPFREGIATREGFKSSAIYPAVKHLGILDQGRILICCGARRVALVGAGVPEGTTFSDAERERLVSTSAALVVPLRMTALLAASAAGQSPLERMLDANGEAVLAVDAAGTILDSSPAAAALMRTDRDLSARVREAIRPLSRDVATVRSGGHVLHVSRCVAERGVAFLVVVDGSGFAEPPVALTERQRELVGYLRRGLTNAEIAAAMGNAPSTVKTMLERLYSRVGVANRVELLAWLQTHGATGQ